MTYGERDGDGRKGLGYASSRACDRVKGFRLVDGKEIFVCHVDSANREYDPQRNGQDRRNDEFHSNHFTGHRGYSL
jgi:hypothetical protein